jgi:hypothetical protein
VVYTSGQYIHYPNHNPSIVTPSRNNTRGLISLWPYKENNKLWDWNNLFTLHIPPEVSQTYDFFNPSKKNYFGCAANRIIRNRKSQNLSAPPPLCVHIRSIYTFCRAITQAVSRRFSTAEARVQPRVWSWEVLWWTKVALGEVFSENFGFPCQSTFHLLLHNHLHYHPSLAQYATSDRSANNLTNQIIIIIPRGMR